MHTDFRLAVRGLIRHPGFTILAVLTLALGIAATSAIFSVVDHLVLRPMPYPNGERMAFVWLQSPPNMGRMMVTPSLALAQQFESGAGSFDRVEIYQGESRITDGASGAEPIAIRHVRPGFFAMLGGRPRVGRTFTPDDMIAGGPRVAMISHAAWRARFGGTRDILEKDIRLDGELYRIVGVMSPGFRSPNGKEEVWIPLRPDDRQPDRGRRVTMLAVLKPGVDTSAATADLNRLTAGSKAEDELTGRGWTAGAIDPSAFANTTLKRASLILFGAVGLLLLIGCANVAALLLTRNSARSRELAVRRALGATRGRLVRLLLFEALALATLAGAAGSILALWTLEIFVALLPDNLSAIDSMRVDARLLGFSACISIATGLLFGLLPAFQGTRQDLTEAMRGDARTGGVTRARHTLRRALTAAEVALALMLLVGAGLLVRSFIQLQRVPLGYDPSQTLAAALDLPQTRYRTPAARQAFYDRMLEEARSLPGVVDVARTSILLPRGGISFGQFRIEGRGSEGPAAPTMYSNAVVSHNYFELMRIPLVAGRRFDDTDSRTTPAALVINETMAKKLWPGESALGKRIGFGPADKSRWLTIVGIVGDVKAAGIRSTAPHADYQLYQSDRQSSFEYGALVLKTSIDPVSVAAPLRARVGAIDPMLPVDELESGEARVAEQFAGERFNLLLLSVFSGLGLALSAIGIYGVMALYVAQRRHEIGIRVALGASAQAVAQLVLRQSLAMAGVGIVAGAIGAALLTRLMQTLLFEVSPTDPLTFAVVIAAVLVVSVGATLLPVRRALRLSPAVALRSN
jgi:putative ABC transport system permease protein